MECENLRILYVPFRVYSMYEFIGDVGSERMEIWKLGIALPHLTSEKWRDIRHQTCFGCVSKLG